MGHSRMVPRMYSERIGRLSGSLIREILALTQKPGVISFAGGLPAPEAMPPLALAGAPQALAQYGTTEGEPELRTRLADSLQALGVPASADQVLVTTGSQQGIDLVSKLFIDPGTPVAVEAPSYLAALQAFRLFGARFVSLPLNPAGVDPEQLRAAIQRERPAFVYLIPTFQNPSGYCYSEAVRRAVARVLDETGTPLVEDEPYRELVYEARERTPISALLERAPWIYLGSFSKTGLPGLRVGYLAATRELHGHLVRIKQCGDLHTNRIGQWWAARFLADADYPAHLERLRTRYRNQRDAMAAALERHFAGLARWEIPGGGLFFWVQLNEALDTRALLTRALTQDVAFMPGEPFFADGDAARGWMRLNFSHAAPHLIDEGLRRLAEVVRGALAAQTNGANAVPL